MSDNPCTLVNVAAQKKCFSKTNHGPFTSLHVHVIVLEEKKKKNSDKHSPCVVPMTGSSSLITPPHKRWLNMIVCTSLRSAL